MVLFNSRAIDFQSLDVLPCRLVVWFNESRCLPIVTVACLASCFNGRGITWRRIQARMSCLDCTRPSSKMRTPTLGDCPKIGYLLHGISIPESCRIESHQDWEKHLTLVCAYRDEADEHGTRSTTRASRFHGTIDRSCGRGGVNNQPSCAFVQYVDERIRK